MARELDKSVDIVDRLNAVIPYQGRSNIAFLCHEAAAEIQSLRMSGVFDGLDAAAAYLDAVLGKGNELSANILRLKGPNQ